jgi:hypothetical protein
LTGGRLKTLIHCASRPPAKSFRKIKPAGDYQTGLDHVATPAPDPLDPLVRATLVALELAVRESGDVLTPDGRVSPLVAASLLHVAMGTLKNWRAAGDGPDFTRIGVTTGAKVSYRLQALAVFLHELRAVRR